MVIVQDTPDGLILVSDNYKEDFRPSNTIEWQWERTSY